MSIFNENGVGTKFGEYILLKKIAAGGMGEIFLAKQTGPTGFEKILVIKRILQHHLENEQYVDMFRSEARVAAMLSHSNVVQVFSMGEVDEHLYLAMEYVHGRSIKEVVTRSNNLGHPVPLAYVADIIAQACAGLSYSHNLKDAADQPLNLIHRDINPHNMLVSYHGELKIIDFGIAKSTMSLNKTETGTIKGKFIYMSPEQSAAEVLDKRSDIFSLTIVLYEMLAGVNPFQFDNIVLSLEAIQRKDPAPITDYRPDAEAFISILRKGLAKNPDDRYFDASEMRDDLQRLLLNKVLPKPAQSLSDWLENIFADSIDADKQVLLETGSGVSRSLSGVKGPISAAKQQNAQMANSQILASNPEADLGSAWSQTKTKAPKKTKKKTAKSKKKPTKKVQQKSSAEIPRASLDDEETRGYEIRAEEPFQELRVEDDNNKPAAATVGLDQREIDDAIAKAIKADAAEQMAPEAEQTAFLANSDGATDFDLPKKDLGLDEETQAFFVAADSAEDFDDEATLRMPGLEDNDSLSDVPIDTLKHDELDLDLESSFSKSNSKLPLLLGLAIGFFVVIAGFLFMRDASHDKDMQSPDAAQQNIIAAIQPDASQNKEDAQSGIKKGHDAASADRIIFDSQNPGADAQVIEQADSGQASPAQKPDAHLAQPAQRDAATTTAQNGAQRVQTKPKHKPKPKPKHKPKAKILGRLIVNPGPNMRSILDKRGGRGAQNFKIRKSQGRFRVKGGAEKFVASFDYQVKKNGIHLNINSYPWSIVSLNGISQGRTPVRISSGRRFSVEFRGPQLQETVRVIIFFRNPD